MVTYTQWFEVVQEEAGRGRSRAEVNNLTREIADYWNQNKAELKGLTKTEARQLARDLLG